MDRSQSVSIGILVGALLISSCRPAPGIYIVLPESQKPEPTAEPTPTDLPTPTPPFCDAGQFAVWQQAKNEIFTTFAANYQDYEKELGAATDDADRTWARSGLMVAASSRSVDLLMTATPPCAEPAVEEMRAAFTAYFDQVQAAGNGETSAADEYGRQYQADMDRANQLEAQAAAQAH